MAATQPMLFTGPQLRSDWPLGTLRHRPTAYGLIMIDPPWSVELYSTRGEEKSAQAVPHHEPGRDRRAADRRTGRARLPAVVVGDSADVARAGPHDRALGVSVFDLGRLGQKDRQRQDRLRYGYVLRGTYEPFLIGVRGALRLARNVRSVVDGAVRSHSRKPDQAYAAAERLVPGGAPRRPLLAPIPPRLGRMERRCSALRPASRASKPASPRDRRCLLSRAVTGPATLLPSRRWRRRRP